MALLVARKQSTNSAPDIALIGRAVQIQLITSAAETQLTYRAMEIQLARQGTQTRLVCRAVESQVVCRGTETRQVYRSVETHLSQNGGMIDLFIRIMALNLGQNQLRAEAAQEECRQCRNEIRGASGAVVTAHNKMAKTMMRYAMAGGILSLVGATLPNIPLGATLNPHRATAAEFFKTAGKGMDSGNQIQNMQTQAKIEEHRTDADIGKQDYEVRRTDYQEKKGANRSIRDEAGQIVQQVLGWFHKLWQ
jgi:hypothetical protein